MTSDPGFLQKIAGSDFRDSLDFCFSGDFQIQPKEITFFEVTYRFMIGPVPFKFGRYSLCRITLSYIFPKCVYFWFTMVSLFKKEHFLNL